MFTDYTTLSLSLLSLVLWGYVWHAILNKMGFFGKLKYFLLLILVFPYTMVFGMIYIAFFPWPKPSEKVKIQKEDPVRLSGNGEASV